MALIDSNILIASISIDKQIKLMLLNNSEQSNTIIQEYMKTINPKDDEEIDAEELKQMSKLISVIYDNIIDLIKRTAEVDAA